MVAINKVAKMLLEGISACASQSDGIPNGDATMLAGKLDDLQ
jgi:hypothetical protein